MLSSIRKKTIFAALASFLAIAAWSTTAAAWNFSNDTCSPEEDYEVAMLPPPQAMLMVDKSGSMGNGISTTTQCHYCSFTANAYKNYCDYTGGQYCEKDSCCFLGLGIEEDWHSFGTETRRCSSCSSDNDCSAYTDDVVGELARNDDFLGPIFSGGEYCGRTGVTVNHNTTNFYVTGEQERPSVRTVADCEGDYRSDMISFLNSQYDGYSNLSIDYRREDNCGSTYASKWAIAKDAINTVTADLTQADPDDVRFGLGWFYGSTASIEREATEDARSGIMSRLNSTGPGGGTPTGAAIRASYNSTTVKDATGGSAGILINDGAPTVSTTSGYDARQEAVREACLHRNVARLYVVGFGSGADTDFNNIVAAAGGTGSCTNGDPCSNPKQWSNFSGTCTGSFQADNAAALQIALANIANQISCTFDISNLGTDWQDPAQGCDSDGYDCLMIKLNGSINQRIYHTSSSNSPKGWEFANSSKTQIRVLNRPEAAQDYCVMLQQGRASDPAQEDVLAKRACMCVENTGSSCGANEMAPPPKTCECPQGDWVCNQGVDTCMPRDPCINDAGQDIPAAGENKICTVGTGACENEGRTTCDGPGNSLVCDVDPLPPPEDEETTCDGIDNDCDGSTDDVVWDNEQCHVDFGVDEDAIINETNRCKIGIAFCDAGGTDGCQAYAPMPEVCNGIDDDCDGQIDNLSTSWANFSQTLSGRYEPASCYERDVCSCMEGPDRIEGATYDAYLESWANNASGEPNPTCTCGEGLTP